ncbi:MAG: J domain-containing protein, partial [Brevundimonas sp.]|nr:J domain-containing protein [Brevundimonas sp.]
DDLYMSCSVPPRLLEDGGRLEVETHAGPRSAWLVAGHQPLRLRLKGLGLPARGTRPQGHLFVTLEPSEDAPSAAEDLLVRFTRVWTPDRLAA